MSKKAKDFKKITDDDILDAAKLIKNIKPIDGEMRVIYKCGHCGHLFGHRFIPMGIGHGMLVSPCLCQLTSHAPSVSVLERRP